jgi:formate dehydrogenase maturation protein FdhE
LFLPLISTEEAFMFNHSYPYGPIRNHNPSTPPLNTPERPIIKEQAATIVATNKNTTKTALKKIISQVAAKIKAQGFEIKVKDLTVEVDRQMSTPPAPFFLDTGSLVLHDRMMRYRRNPSCPECDAHPVVCMMRRPNYRSFRCRTCGYRWEDTG